MSVRPLTKCQRLMLLLAPGKWVPMSRLLDVGGYRYGARLYDLRRRGFDHETRRNQRTGAFEYRRLA